MSEDIAISVKNLSKNFKLPHQKNQSVKSVFINMMSLGNKTFETQHALNDISFEVKKGEFFGIVGRNGSGKSTLLKILAGIYQPTKGSVQVKGRLVPFIELGVGFNPELTGRENVYLNGALLGFSEKEVESKYNAIVEFAEIERFMDQKLKNYSSGMQVRLAFSVATVLAESDILLIDEVLAVGDAEFQRKCFSYFRNMKKLKKTIIFVSHDMNAIRQYCDKAILIENSIVIATGSAEKVAAKYTKLFLENNDKVDNQKKDANRWGEGGVKYTEATILVNEDYVTVAATIVADKAIENPNIGFSIKDATGTDILGTNSYIKKKSIKCIEANKAITIKWITPNIFQDGVHSLSLAIVGEDGQILDWWEDCKEFKILKEEITPYKVNPSMVLEIRP